MKYSLDVVDWRALAPGINDASQWVTWAANNTSLPVSDELAKSQRIPMMTARRMSPASRLAVEASLDIMDRHSVDMAIFTSRHGELERTYKIVQSLAKDHETSPTDFSMSVHNTAAGWMTIAGKKIFPVTSLAAGEDSFQQGFLEAFALLNTGIQHVLLVDFDGAVPSVYKQNVPSLYAPYATAFLLAKGSMMNCERVSGKDIQTAAILPQSLQFLRGWLNAEHSFPVAAKTHLWQWATQRDK